MSEIPSREELQDAISTAHAQRLGHNLLGLMTVGSTNNGLIRPQSDIDYVVITQDLTTRVLKESARTRTELEDTIGMPMSNTVIGQACLRRFQWMPEQLDGKATQGLIENYRRPAAWAFRRPDFRYWLPTPDVISNYSRTNFFVLSALTTKTLVRAENDNAFHKMAKISLIALKMLAQHYKPDCCQEGDWRESLPTYARPLAGTVASFKQREYKLSEEEQDIYIDSFNRAVGVATEQITSYPYREDTPSWRGGNNAQ